MFIPTINIHVCLNRLLPSRIFYQIVEIGEYMDIICPQYDLDETNVMTFVIYNVTKQVFDSCGKINEGK